MALPLLYPHLHSDPSGRRAWRISVPASLAIHLLLLLVLAFLRFPRSPRPATSSRGPSVRLVWSNAALPERAFTSKGSGSGTGTGPRKQAGSAAGGGMQGSGAIHGLAGGAAERLQKGVAQGVSQVRREAFRVPGEVPVQSDRATGPVNEASPLSQQNPGSAAPTTDAAETTPAVTTPAITPHPFGSLAPLPLSTEVVQSAHATIIGAASAQAAEAASSSTGARIRTGSHLASIHSPRATEARRSEAPTAYPPAPVAGPSAAPVRGATALTTGTMSNNAASSTGMPSNADSGSGSGPGSGAGGGSASGSGSGRGDGAGTGNGSGNGDGNANGSGNGGGNGTGGGEGGPFGIGGAGAGGEPRHAVYLLDVSPSMLSRIDRAREELSAAIRSLRPDESLDILAFSADCRRFSRSLVPATPANIAAAEDFLAATTLSPATNLERALKQALQIRGVNVVFVITDGVPTLGETNFDRLAEKVVRMNRTHARIYTVGLVGRNPDGTDDSFAATRLLHRIASESGGDCKIVTVGVATPD